MKIIQCIGGITMKQFVVKCVLPVCFLLLASCATTTTTWVPLTVSKLNTKERAKTVATVYIRTFGEERFMSTSAMILGAFSAMASSAALQLSMTNMQQGNYRTSENLSDLAKSINESSEKIAQSIEAANYRKNSSEFEKKMGDFDLYSYFVKTLYEARDSIKYFNFEMNFDSTEHAQIINRICTYDKEKLDTSFSRTLYASGDKYLSAFKFQYGIGARVGSEQMSLTKK